MDQAPLSVEPLVDRAAALADSVLAPVAEQVDIDGVIPADHFRALADAGLFGMLGPVDAGGSDVSAQVARRTMANIAGGCGSTFFVWAQHHGVVRTLRSSANEPLRDQHLRALCAGELIAGVAFAHARRVGARPLRATRFDGGWWLDGFAPWTTSWGIADLFAIAAGIEPRPLPLPVLVARSRSANGVDRQPRRARRRGPGNPAPVRCGAVASRHRPRHQPSAAGRTDRAVVR